jgi:hypothetical protein
LKLASIPPPSFLPALCALSTLAAQPGTLVFLITSIGVLASFVLRTDPLPNLTAVVQIHVRARERKNALFLHQLLLKHEWRIKKTSIGYMEDGE